MHAYSKQFVGWQRFDDDRLLEELNHLAWALWDAFGDEGERRWNPVAADVARLRAVLDKRASARHVIAFGIIRSGVLGALGAVREPTADQVRRTAAKLKANVRRARAK